MSLVAQIAIAVGWVALVAVILAVLSRVARHEFNKAMRRIDDELKRVPLPTTKRQHFIFEYDSTKPETVLELVVRADGSVDLRERKGSKS